MNPILSSEYTENTDTFLYDVHYDDLRASGLSDETMALEGFQSIDDVNIIAADLGWEPSASLERIGPFLRIPYRRANGSPMAYCRYKPLYPRNRTKDDGTAQLVKYEAPIRKSPPPYFPAGAIEPINTAQATLFITEGEKKAATATQEGFPCIGLPGVSNWSKKRKENRKVMKVGRRHLNKWLRHIDWQGREVFVVFDTDAGVSGSRLARSGEADRPCGAYSGDRSGKAGLPRRDSVDDRTQLGAARPTAGRR